MDIEILRDLFNGFRPGGRRCSVQDADVRRPLAAARARLAPIQIGHLGQIQEWLMDWDEAALEHAASPRLAPVGAATRATRSPRAARRSSPTAARKSLELRGDAATGWSLAWKINLLGAAAGRRPRLQAPDRPARSRPHRAEPVRPAPAVPDRRQLRRHRRHRPRCCCRATPARCTCCPHCRRLPQGQDHRPPRPRRPHRRPHLERRHTGPRPPGSEPERNRPAAHRRTGHGARHRPRQAPGEASRGDRRRVRGQAREGVRDHAALTCRGAVRVKPADAYGAWEAAVLLRVGSGRGAGAVGFRTEAGGDAERRRVTTRRGATASRPPGPTGGKTTVS